MRWELVAAEAALCGRLKIGFGGREDVRDKFLRVAISDRKPRTLDLHHDLGALEEPMVQRVQAETAGQQLPGRNGFEVIRIGMLIDLDEFANKNSSYLGHKCNVRSKPSLRISGAGASTTNQPNTIFAEGFRLRKQRSISTATACRRK